VRCHIKGLAGNEALKARLEISLKGQSGITVASISLVTGNILLFYTPAYSPQSIAELIEDYLGDSNTKALPEDQTRRVVSGQTLLPETMCSKARMLVKGVLEKVSSVFAGEKIQEERPWHALQIDTVLDALETDGVKGLDSSKAMERIALYGANALPPPQSRSRWGMFLHQFLSLPVALLGAAAFLSVITGGLLDAAIIMGVVVANATVGYVTESTAERTIESLRNLMKPTAMVIRDGIAGEINAEELVPGDIILLKQGSYVPADARILDAANLTVDESALTGESMPVQKTMKVMRRENVSLPDRTNMVYMGTLVTGGQCVAVVVATGSFTQMGLLQRLLQETSAPETPIERQLRQMGDHLVILCLSICGIVFVFGILRGYGALEMLKMSISLAAAAVPEGLPAAATVNFALGIGRMRTHGVLVRRLQTVETLGAVQTLCLDKTGTITRNRMTVVECYAGMKHFVLSNGSIYSGDREIKAADVEELKLMAEVSALCNEAREESSETAGSGLLNGSPTEMALLSFAAAAGVNVRGIRSEKRLLKTNHRSENRLFMSTLHEVCNSERLFCVKGSPVEVLAMCSRHIVDGVELPLGEEERLAIEIENDRMAADMLRVLGVAFRQMDAEDQSHNDEPDLVWLGLIAMADPIREGVEDLIAVFHRAGIDTVMITGDQSATAHAVAKKLNLSKGEKLEILDSSNLVSIDADLMRALAGRVHVYSRVSPAHKLTVVKALQAAGKVVAMTGDGVNDSPALKAADIGISMGQSGTDLAREVSDVVLKDDDLKTLVVALEDGRTIHLNIKKSVHFFLSTNFSEIAAMSASIVAGIGTPMNVMQLLWINLISDIFPGLAISLEPPEKDVLDRPPLDPGRPLFSGREYASMAREAAVIAGASVAGYAFGISRYGLGPQAGTIAFQSLVIAQLLHALSCRSDTKRIMNGSGPRGNPYLAAAVGGSLMLQILTMVAPGLRTFLGLSPISLLDAAVAAGAGLASLSINEALKTQPR
jgi:Ca2+-transporting ATPase